MNVVMASLCNRFLWVRLQPDLESVLPDDVRLKPDPQLTPEPHELRMCK